MATQDGDLVVVFNGEIYNYKELRAELEALGCLFVTTHSDTEVLLHGFRQWGRDLPNRLNGMWAFALYDRRAKTLFCCRDRFGKKPFYYTVQNGAFVFGSELTALKRHPGVTARFSKLALQKYFAYGFIPAPHSIHEGIHKLPGGHSLWVNAETLQSRVEKYWDFVLEPTSQIPRHPEEEWGEQIRHLLDQAVRRRLMSDVPLGIFLSGGIDSSAITAFASRHVPEGQLKTFSIGFEEATFDESAYAKQVADLFHTDHYSKQLSLCGAHALLGEIAAHLDEPLGDSSLLPATLLSRFTRTHVTVALGGDGGDELFAGYDPFLALRRAELYSKLIPRPIHQAIRLLFERLPVSHGNMSLDFKIKRTLRGLGYPARVRMPAWMGPLDAREIEELFCERVDIEELYESRSCKHDEQPRSARAVFGHRTGGSGAPHPEQLQVPQRHNEISLKESVGAGAAARDSLPQKERVWQSHRGMVQERHTECRRNPIADAKPCVYPSTRREPSRRTI